MMNQNQTCINYETEEATGFCADLLDKQDYFDFIDTDMEAYYSIKSEAVASNV